MKLSRLDMLLDDFQSHDCAGRGIFVVAMAVWWLKSTISIDAYRRLKYHEQVD